MKKLKFSIFLLVFAMFITSCSKAIEEKKDDKEQISNNEKTQPEEQIKVEEPITIKFANYAVLEQGYAPFWEGVKKGFEEKYPNIKIEWVSAPYGEIVNQVINMAGSGNKVDIIFGENVWAPTFEDAGLAVPIDTILTKEFLDDFYQTALEANNINGKSYAVPLYISPYIVYYNKEIFEKAGLDPEKPPTTYDEMLQMAEKISLLKTDDGNKIYAFGQTTASVPISGSSLTAMLYNFGGTLLKDDLTINADTSEFKQMVEMLKLLNEKGYNPENAKLKDLRNLFALGQLAMYYDQSWGFNGVQSINPDAKKFTASAMPLKGGNGTGESIIQEHAVILVDNGEKNKEAVRLLVEYLITEETLSDYMENLTPAYPSRKSMSNMKAVTENSILKGAANSIEKAQPTPFIPTLSELNLELTTLGQAVTVGGKEVDVAIKEFKDATKSLLE